MELIKLPLSEDHIDNRLKQLGRDLISSEKDNVLQLIEALMTWMEGCGQFDEDLEFNNAYMKLAEARLWYSAFLYGTGNTID